MERTRPITLSELADRLSGRLVGEGAERTVEGVSTIQDAGPAEVCYYGNRKYAKYLATTKALAVITSSEENTSASAQILVENAYAAFREALAIFSPDRRTGFQGIDPSARIHQEAEMGSGVSIGPCTVIDRGARIGADTTVGAGCYIGPRARTGAGCELHSGVVIEADCSIGDRVIIHAGAVLGSDGFGFVPDSGGEHLKVPQNGNVVVADHVEIGANCTIDRAVTGSTIIGEYSKLDNLVHVAHNVTIGKGCLIAAQTGIAGSTRIGDGVVFGGQVGLVGHIEIGDGARCGAQAGVTKDVPPGVTVSGYPARPHREALRMDALVSRLPDLFEKLERHLRDHSAEKDSHT